MIRKVWDLYVYKQKSVKQKIDNNYVQATLILTKEGGKIVLFVKIWEYDVSWIAS